MLEALQLDADDLGGGERPLYSGGATEHTARKP
jgi:hypothetical protein